MCSKPYDFVCCVFWANCSVVISFEKSLLIWPVWRSHYRIWRMLRSASNLWLVTYYHLWLVTWRYRISYSRCSLPFSLTRFSPSPSPPATFCGCHPGYVSLAYLSLMDFGMTKLSLVLSLSRSVAVSDSHLIAIEGCKEQTWDWADMD